MGWRERVQRREARRWNRYMYEEALKSKYKPNGKSVEIIGMPSAVFTHLTTDQNPGSLTQTTFDTDSRADSAQILLTNSTGVSRVIIAAWIRGKPVTRYSDTKAGSIPGAVGGSKGGSRGGYLHDKFVDYESIAKNGERVFETGNNFTVTADQVNKLADYYWKLNKTKKHIYTLSLVGFQTWYEPGEWYTLQIGGAGQAEYIDSTVECMGVQCSLAAGGAPNTSVAFREVEESWKFDSNEVARQIAAGDFSRRTNSNVVTVAAQYYPGYADYYCDGTDDQEEINGALSYQNHVHLVAGNYNISTSITMSSGSRLTGEGVNTTITNTVSGLAMVIATGSAATYLTNIQVSDIKINGTDEAGPVFALQFCDGFTISNCVVENAIATLLCNPSKNGMFVNNRIVGPSSATYNLDTGIIYLANYEGQHCANLSIIGNHISDFKTAAWTTGFVAGICVNDTALTSVVDISNNIIDGLSYASSSAINTYGIYIADGDRTTVSSNRITRMHSSSGTAYGVYIATGVTGVVSTNNYCFGNGADTGIANTNSNNFKDNGTDTQWAG